MRECPVVDRLWGIPENGREGGREESVYNVSCKTSGEGRGGKLYYITVNLFSFLPFDGPPSALRSLIVVTVSPNRSRQSKVADFH